MVLEPKKGSALGLSDITTFDAEDTRALGAVMASEPIVSVASMAWTSAMLLEDARVFTALDAFAESGARRPLPFLADGRNRF